jgi:hypothetical protein
MSNSAHPVPRTVARSRVSDRPRVSKYELNPSESLVLFGFVMRHALITGAVLILVLTFGSTLRQKCEIAGLQLTYMLVDAILLAFRRHNTVSIDRLIEFGIADSTEVA